ncbi:(2Fe-2S)-binding protein [Idiomarina tyrosinivorans]|uniref:Bacterioferritin-associated ferredoxin n=1 Tax=Idiomarina tyrosinivorans TaxID=1445662 RepID=A0A432ZPE5_9GAMM|nr:bacterioferritin-associated ferredoxin [Idiomarina tyrosinivorans]RUO79764.1 (2Fe-2S)-binding protein [Idiomarina tyrosinivorans]
MYVCLCKGVTDKTIRKAVAEDGVTSIRELRQQYGVASQCGCCKQCAKQVLAEALAEQGSTPRSGETPVPVSVCYT